jgi:polar amino acid transport system substrate-binding protein
VGPSPSAFWATRDGSGPRGVTVDLGRAAAAKLAVPLQLVEYRNAGEITAAASQDKWDIAFMPHEAEREKLMDHGPAYVSYDSTYIVRAGSDVRSAAQLDRTGVRVGAVEGTSTSRTVARSLKHAALDTFPKADEAVTQLAQGRVDALAMGREALVDVAKKVPGTRILDDVIQSTNVVVVVPKGRPATREWAARFLEDAKRDGTVRRALDGAGFTDAAVAPAAAPRG